MENEQPFGNRRPSGPPLAKARLNGRSPEQNQLAEPKGSHSTGKPFISRTMLNLLLVLALVGFLLYMFSEIVVYLVLALIITSILRTPTNYISQFEFYGLRIPRIVATLLAFALLISVLGLFIYLFVPLVQTQAEVIGNIDFKKWSVQIITPVQFLEDFLIENRVVEQEKGFLIEQIRQTITQLLENLKVGDFLNNLLDITSSFLIGALAVSFITFFMLYEKGLMKRYLISLIPNKYFEVSIAALSRTEQLLSNYLLGLLLQMLSIFSVASFGLLVAGIEYAVTIGVFAAVANLIPFLGPLLGASFGLIVGISTNPDLATAQDYAILVSKIIAVFGVVQITDNILLQPLIFSRSIKAHPLEIFLIVFVGASIANAIGMIAAIPTYTILKVSFQAFMKGYKQYQVFRN